ncbi:hypothetical protein B7463_g6039, partial [Scytalidium lignicola]
MKHVPSKQELRARFTSIKSWELPKHESTLAPEDVWTNADMDPVPRKYQTWTNWTWIAYWASDCINVATWETASGIIDVGLTWRDAIPIIFIACVCVTIPLYGNGHLGAKLHIPFAVAVRSGFGFNLAYFAIVSRAVLGTFWLGVQSVNGSYCLTVMLRAIWPSYVNIPNHLPESAGITTMAMCSYFLFWLIQFPLLLIPPTRLRYLFLVKMIITPITALAMLGWSVHKAGGSGTLFQLPGTVHGSARAWFWLNCMTSVTGSWATLACNIPDFSRYAKSTKYQYLQIPMLPVIYTLCGVIGIITTSASKVIYGQYLWNPLDIVAHWLDDGSHGGRAAAFFAGLSWYIAQVGTNITANSISAANDLTVLSPRWINIKRGCIICAIVGGWVIVPWKVLASATTFLSFMGGYSIFLAPISGLLFSDYWLVKGRNYDVPALYNPRGRYHYPYGINWRALFSLLISVGPNLPGLVNAINPKITVSAGVLHIYDFGWLYGFWSSVVVYTALSRFFPVKEMVIEKTIYGISLDEDQDSRSETASNSITDMGKSVTVIKVDKEVDSTLNIG